MSTPPICPPVSVLPLRRLFIPSTQNKQTKTTSPRLAFPLPYPMARDRDPFPAGALLLTLTLLLTLLTLNPAVLGSVVESPRLPTPRAPLIIPLHFHRANSTRAAHPGARRLSTFHGRRYLQEEDEQHPAPLLPNAHMRLYDNLLTNGYYTTKIGIGTPPQQFALIVDSGSTVTYVPCSSCEQCGNHQDPRFQPDKSSTYQPVKCNPDCSCDSDRNQCVYERQYAEMSSSSGVLGNDLMTFGPESDLKPQHAVFGCENSETGDLYSQHADGIMGLGRGQLSIVDQLVEKGVIDDAFSLCYGGMDIGGGAMVLGRIDPPTGMVWARSDPVRSPYYNIELKKIQVAGKALKLDPKVFDSRHGTVLDSGTTYAYLPEQAFVAFRDALIDQLHSLKQVPGPDPNYKDICFGGASRNVYELSKTFPDVEMVFGNGQKILLSPENYLFKHSKVEGAYCLGVFQNGKDPTTLLGGIIVRNTLVTYDRQNEKIGFWKTNCSELWDRLQADGAPATAPSPPPNNTNSTTVVAPALPPLPGEIEIGRITFDMSINVTYNTLKPYLPEIAKYIAKELEIDVHQVEMVNVTSKGNYTLIRWAILPAGSSKFMSNATAMEIINRLTEHRVQLPENLGSYQLLEWNVTPPSNRSWWHQHMVGVFVGVMVLVVLSLSALLAWSIWKKRATGPGTYRPVSAPVPEQELQPI